MQGHLIRFLFSVCVAMGTLSLVLAESSSLPPSQPSIALEQVIETLSQSPSGERLLARAGTQLERLKWGPVSRTDAILTRHFEASTGQEKREREVTIYLKQDQGLEESVLDLAHELIHALSGPQWDPYDPGLTSVGYIQAVIDGVGGEVDALVSECSVSLELAELKGWNPGRCIRYGKPGNSHVDREKVRKDFYTVGKWKKTVEAIFLKEGLEKNALPLMSDEHPVFYSSTGRAPYPASLAQEFKELTEIACGNSLRRLSTLSSTLSSEGLKAKTSAQDFVQKRCLK